MTFRITDWHLPIDGVARAESRFGARGACRRAHRHDARTTLSVEPISPPLPSAPSRRHQWSTYCRCRRTGALRADVIRLCRVFGGVGESYIDGGFSCGTWCQAPHGVDAGVSSDGEITTLGTRSGIPVLVRLATFISPCENASNWRKHDLQPNRRQCPL